MLTQQVFPSSHSATVQLTVEIDGQAYPLSTVEPDRFVLNQPLKLSCTAAILNVNIDGHVQQTEITITPAEAPTREYKYTRQ